MSKIDYQVLRDVSERAITAMTHLSILPGDDDLLSEKKLKELGIDIDAIHAFKIMAGPETVLSLLDERDALNERMAELEANLAELAEDQQKAIESIKQADAAVKLAHEKFSALAAENAGLKSGAMDEIKVINRGGQAYCVKDGVQVNPMYARGWNDYRAKSLQSDTPATDAFLSEIERKAIRKFINSIEHILRDKLSPYDTEKMLEAMRIFLEEQGDEQK
ncbi:TPA: ead/Ea22-like family protein [Escherichia coli]